MRLLLVRHGETDWPLNTRVQGRLDTPLNATGHRQAALLGEALRTEGIAAIYASPLQRAQATAAAIAQHHGLAVVTLPGLSELDQGDLEGLPAAEIRTHPSGVHQHWQAGNFGFVIPGGESLEALQVRAWLAVQAIMQQVGQGTAVAVSHNLTTKTIICSALGLPLGTYRNLRKDNCSITTLEFTPERVTLVRLNDTSHYASVLRPDARPSAAATAP